LYFTPIELLCFSSWNNLLEFFTRQAARFVKEAGALMAVQVTMEVPMNSSNPYFLSTWRRDPDFKVKGDLDKVMTSFIFFAVLVCHFCVFSSNLCLQSFSGSFSLT
jgi:hypothetical protein